MKQTKGKLTHGMKSHVHVSTWHIGEGKKCHEEEQVGDTWKPCVTPLGQTQGRWKKINSVEEKKRKGKERKKKGRKGEEKNEKEKKVKRGRKEMGFLLTKFSNTTIKD